MTLMKVLRLGSNFTHGVNRVVDYDYDGCGELRLEEDDAGDAGGTGDVDESAQIGLKLYTGGYQGRRS